MRVAVLSTEAAKPFGDTVVRCLCSHNILAEGFTPIDDLRFSACDYIVVVASPSTLMGSVPVSIRDSLARCGSIAGKKAALLLVRYGFRNNKALQTILKQMEGEGLIVNCFELVRNQEQAAEFALTLPIKETSKD